MTEADDHKGLDLKSGEAQTPIGVGCKVCEREGCLQRAFPAIGRPLVVDETSNQFAPYSVARDDLPNTLPRRWLALRCCGFAVGVMCIRQTPDTTPCGSQQNHQLDMDVVVLG